MLNPLPAIDPDWSLVEKRFAIETNRHYESVFALGTGYMTLRSSIDEGFADDDQSREYNRFMDNTTLEVIPAGKSRWGTYMPVVQADHPFLRVGLVNLPYVLGLAVAVDDEKLDLERCRVSNYRRWLDLRSATLYRELVWETAAGQTLALTFRRFLDRTLKFVCVQEVGITMLAGSGEVTVRGGIDAGVRTNGYNVFAETHVVPCEDGLVYSDVRTNLGARIVTASALQVNGRGTRETARGKARIEAVARLRLSAGESAHALKISAIAADAYFPAADLEQAAVGLVRSAAAMGPAALHARHAARWRQLWDACDVQLEAADDPGYNSQLAIRAAMYHLLRAKAPDEDRALLCPKGTTTEVYFGSVFWDMEIFIQPFYLHTDAVTARTTPMFRARNLPGALALAEKQGYRGARYPWQSDCYGHETCVPWQYADHQVHITADVVIGIWEYAQNCQDFDFLWDHGAEVIVQTARYWTARVDQVPGRPGWHVLGVMGPDEYKPLTNNNAYTNHCVRFHLNLAARVIELMAAQAPDKFAALRAKVSLQPGEAAHFKEIAAGLPIPMDEAGRRVWQCDGFDTDYAEVDIDALWTDRTRLFGHFMSQEKRYRSKVMKQSDAVALLGLFTEDYTTEQKAATFDYYDRYNIHDSSNSMVHHQIVAANLGRDETAYDAWKRSIDIDFGRFPRSSDGVHMANVGGMWQEVVFGFAGMVRAVNTDVLTFRPCLPRQIRRIAFRVLWRGQWVAVEVTSSEIAVHNLGSRRLASDIVGEQVELEPGETKRVLYGR